MLKIKNFIFFSVAVTAVIFFAGISSCKKEVNCVGGPGGSLTIKATLAHHGEHIYSLPNYHDTVYVKYNSKDFPANGMAGFDTKFVGEEGTDYVLLTGLRCGDYYFYAAGRDTAEDTLVYPHVTGGTPFSTMQATGEQDINLAVSESH